ncbi:hypothetical protein C4E04_19060 [Microvirga sp. 17 mud 1-3]|nr:hypothetical protein C4E04_19060 [Microvirga sp. 17 mud 1-3]
MSTWQVALVREQGVTFGVVSVRDSVIDSPSQRDDLIRWWTMKLGCPAVLIGAQRHRTYGRQDIVRFLRNVHPSQLPWRKMNVA